MERRMKMKKIAKCLVLSLILCMCLSACREAGSETETTARTTAAAETVGTAAPEQGTAAEPENDQISIGETQEPLATVTMPDIGMPTQPEEDYQVSQDPQVTVGYK